MKVNEINISILIPTYCRKSDLLETLKCIENQTYKNFEVILVDASPKEMQLNDVELSEFDFPIKYERYGIPGNVSKQRNIGLKLAIGEIILFLDDDVTFGEELLANYTTIFNQNNGYKAITGLVETKMHRKGNLPLPVSKRILTKIDYTIYHPCDFVVETPIICTANFAFKKELFQKFGGFDEKIFGTCDDADYGLYLYSKGIKIIHHNKVSVFHHQTTASGARSGDLPKWWSYYNLCYFQLKNKKYNFIYFLVIVTLQDFRPSRLWLSPLKFYARYKSFLDGLLKANAALKN